MDYRYTVIEGDGTECIYDHIMTVRNVSEFKYGMEICVVQNEDTMDIWALAPVYQTDTTKTDYDAAHESLARYYHDQYGWNYGKMTAFTFRVEL